MKKILLLILPIALIICISSCGKTDASEDISEDWATRCESDARRFAELYNVSEQNPYIFATFEELVTQLELGTGVIAFGFPDCPRCQNVFPVLERVFKESKMDQHAGYRGKILYYDIFDDRDANNERYQILVGFLKDFLNADDSGNPRIFVPDIFFVNTGTIIGNHMDTVPSMTDPFASLNNEQTMELTGIYMDLLLEMENCDC